ncbi:MAG: YvcK family protein [Armatimonadetes bacterium]|nr:YvcK family protein [Armatimonadota bacterium]
MINRYRLRRMMAPTAGLRSAAAVLLLGLLILVAGFAISFVDVFSPALKQMRIRWDGLMASVFGRTNADQASHILGLVFLLGGLYLVFVSARQLVRRMLATLNPTMKSRQMVNVFVRRQQLAAGPRVVALGGGTGLSTLLRGLKQHTSNITAIVTVTDDGGSSGRLSKELGVLPPGDIRNCLVALSDAEKLMTDLFQHRFKNARGSLAGHSLGNLLIAGLIEQYGGDFDKALTAASEVLNIRGRVIPSTLEKVRLRALMADGTEICGETDIAHAGMRIRRVFIDPEHCEPYHDALAAIKDADLIVIGPGSVYTSVIPNLLIPGIANALSEATAVKAYICNVMTQPGESDEFTAAEHVAAIQANVDLKVFDHVVCNTGAPSQVTLDKYREFDQYFVEPDVDRVRALGFRVVSGNFMNEADYVRHDPMKVAARLMEIVR